MKKRLRKVTALFPTRAPKCVLSHLLLRKILHLSSPRVNGFKLPEGRFGLEMRKRFFTIL